MCSKGRFSSETRCRSISPTSRRLRDTLAYRDRVRTNRDSMSHILESRVRTDRDGHTYVEGLEYDPRIRGEALPAGRYLQRLEIWWKRKWIGLSNFWVRWRLLNNSYQLRTQFHSYTISICPWCAMLSPDHTFYPNPKIFPIVKSVTSHPKFHPQCSPLASDVTKHPSDNTQASPDMPCEPLWISQPVVVEMTGVDSRYLSQSSLAVWYGERHGWKVCSLRDEIGRQTTIGCK